MSLRSLALLLLLLPLAGCLGGGPDPAGAGVGDPCAWGVCAADLEAHPEWTLPEGAEPLWTFGGPYTAVTALVVMDPGWAWIAKRDGVTRVEAFDPDAGTLHSHALPPRHSVGQDGLVGDDGALWFTHTRVPDGGPVLARWTPATDDLEQWPLQGLDRHVTVTDPGPPVLLSAPSGTPATQVFAFQPGAFRSNGLQPDGVLSPVGPDDPYTSAAAVEGNTILRVDVRPAHDGEGATLVLQDRVSGSQHNVTTTNETVVGAWGQGGRFAYATTGSDETTLWGLDNRELTVEALAPGRHPWFTPQGVYTWVEEPGVNPSVHFTPTGSDASSALVFPASAEAWAASGPRLWWFGEPSTDPRFDEAPNPTPFVTALHGLA